jgi:3-methyladenine DNA glycosylase AlkD
MLTPPHPGPLRCLVNSGHADLLAEIRRAAGPPPRVQQHNDSYGGSGHPYYRTPVPARRAIAKAWLARNRTRPVEEFPAVVESLFAGESHEEKTLAAILLGYHSSARRETGAMDVGRWLGHLNGWAEIDALCHNVFTATELLADWPAWERLIKRQSREPDPSRRRAALVLLTGPTHASGDVRLRHLAIASIDLLRTERDPLVTKAISWLLRSMIIHHRGTVTRYVRANETVLPKIVVRETRTKLDTGTKHGRT